MAEERGGVDDSGLTEEDRSVLSTTLFRNLPSPLTDCIGRYGAVVRGPDAYVPPGARKGPLSRFGANPNGASTPPNASAPPYLPRISEPTATPAPSNGHATAAPAGPTPANSITLEDNMRAFVTSEKARLTQRRDQVIKAAERKDQDSRIKSLLEFSQNFKVRLSHQLAFRKAPCYRVLTCRAVSAQDSDSGRHGLDRARQQAAVRVDRDEPCPVSRAPRARAHAALAHDARRAWRQVGLDALLPHRGAHCRDPAVPTKGCCVGWLDAQSHPRPPASRRTRGVDSGHEAARPAHCVDVQDQSERTRVCLQAEPERELLHSRALLASSDILDEY